MGVTQTKAVGIHAGLRHVVSALREIVEGQGAWVQQEWTKWSKCLEVQQGALATEDGGPLLAQG